MIRIKYCGPTYRWPGILVDADLSENLHIWPEKDYGHYHPKFHLFQQVCWLTVSHFYSRRQMDLQLFQECMIILLGENCIAKDEFILMNV